MQSTHRIAPQSSRRTGMRQPPTQRPEVRRGAQILLAYAAEYPRAPGQLPRRSTTLAEGESGRWFWVAQRRSRVIFVVEPNMRTAGAGAIPRPSTAPGGWVAMVGDDSEGEVMIVVQGRIEGMALDALGAALDAAARGSARRVQVDLAAVTQWSLLAQAMVLTTARRVSRRGLSWCCCRRDRRPTTIVGRSTCSNAR